MNDHEIDRNVLFGVMATRMEFITKDDFLHFVGEWIKDKSRTIDQMMVASGKLQAKTRELLIPLVDSQLSDLEVATSDAQATLIQLSSDIADRLSELSDPDLDTSLSRLTRPQLETSIGSKTSVTAGHAQETRSASTDSSRYRVVKPHAKGGLGHVSVAYDLEVNREVALKEIQERHAHDRENRQRFLREAEITGGLEHPGVVPVYGIGTYSDGRPYYAMRFIRGKSLKEAIGDHHGMGETSLVSRSDRSISLRRLIGVFIDVCNAIEYAHSRGVIHRDIKPGNIMLGKFGETLVVDWGLAKTVGRSETVDESEEQTLHAYADQTEAQTVAGDVMGTPAYMSPEQASGDVERIGTATDVYSLGATLYCLLVGEPPIVNVKPTEAIQRIRTGDFERITKRPRDIHQQPISPALRSICDRAMNSEPDSRYSSAQELAADLERWLADESVESHRDSLLTRAGRLIRRKQTLFVSALVATILLSVGLTALSLLLSAHSSNLSSLNAQITDEKQAAVQRENRETLIRGLLLTELRNDDPGEVLDDLRPLFENDLIGFTAIIQDLGGIYSDAGQWEQSIEFRERSVQSVAELVGHGELDTFREMNELAIAYYRNGDYQKSVATFEEVVVAFDNELGELHEDTLAAKGNLAASYQEVGRTAEAIPLLEQVFEMAPIDTVVYVTHGSNLASALWNTGRALDAANLFERLLETVPRLPPERQIVIDLGLRNNITMAYLDAKQPDQAMQFVDSLIEQFTAQFGPTSPITAVAMTNKAIVLYAAGNRSDALELFRDSLEIKRLRIGDTHPSTLDGMSNYAVALEDRGDYHRAEVFHRLAMEGQRTRADEQRAPLAVCLDQLARNLLLQPMVYPEAERYLTECIGILEEEAPNSWRRFNAMNQLGSVYARRGRVLEAERLLIQGYDGLVEREPMIRVIVKNRIIEAIDRIIEYYDLTNRPEEQARWLAERTLMSERLQLAE